MIGKNFNLTEWSLKRQQLVWFFIVLLFFGGIFSYMNLGRMEDPEFAVREMYMQVSWPGASAEQMEEQVTDVIERKLQDIPNKDYIRSFSLPNQAIIFIALSDSVPEENVRDTWVEVRNTITDIKKDLPSTVQGPIFNDRYDDVYGCIYALTGDGYTYEQLREQAESIRRTFLQVDDVKKVELLGVQSEKVYIEIENNRMAQLGISSTTISDALAAANTVMSAGMMQTEQDNVCLRVSGMFDDVDMIADLPITAGGDVLRLGDIATITRDYSDPADPMMFYNGEPAVGISVSMEEGGNVMKLGENLDETLEKIKETMTLGYEINQVANQPEAVQTDVDEFIETLVLAIVIVLLVSFLSLGKRAGVVVGLCIPLVTVIVLVGMYILGVPLHKVSIGALITALGMLVDDEVIAIEMMQVKMDEGWDRFKAGCHAYTSTAFPMLTGTLATCAGFLPVFLADGPAAEYTGSMFVVIALALISSWFVSVCVTPVLGYHLLKANPLKENQKDIYDTPFNRLFRKVLEACLKHKKRVLCVACVIFCMSGMSLKNVVPTEFFPSATRPELLVDLTLPAGTSIAETERTAKELSDLLAEDEDIVEYSYYVGRGAPRFVLSLEPGMQASNFAQFVIMTEDVDAREDVHQRIQDIFNNGFENVRSHIKTIQNGPPSAYPVMLRISGEDIAQVKEIADDVRAVVIQNEDTYNVNFDWYEKTKTMKIDIDQDKARTLGVTSQQISGILASQISGQTVSQFREDDKSIDIVLKAENYGNTELSNIEGLQIPLPSGQYVPLEQIATIHYEAEEGMIGRRDLQPTITVQAEVVDGASGDDVTKEIYEELEEMREALPFGYSIEIGGSLERSNKGMAEVMKVMPVVVLIILVLLMLQMQDVKKLAIAIMTAPLCIIGVNAGLLLFGCSFGFVAKLGTLALFGIVIRNSVVIIEQIDEHIKAGMPIRKAIIESAVERFRPILATAATTILGLLPLIPNAFWGPMAVAMSGGLLVATVLTLLVLPSIYAVVFHIEEEPEQA